MENGYQKAYFPDKAYQYEKCWDVPADWKGKSVYLEFEGVFRDAEVLLNKNAVVRKYMGYTGFCVCLDDYLDYGKSNTVTVTAKSGKEQHWYSGTGIYRLVNIMVGNLLHFAPNGVKITPVDVDDDSAVAIVETRIRNKNHFVQKFQLHTEICDRNGQVVGEEAILVTMKGNSETTCRQRIALQQIRCWSLEEPELYTCSCSTKTEDEIVDSETASFGIRRISVDAKHGFRLNGKKIKLRGACIHHDAGIIGGIANKSVEKRRIRKLKKAGFNAVRMAHNPSSTAVLEACDEEGMLVMEESFNVWNVMRFVDDYSSFFDDNWERDLTETVEHAYNHPSVIMYSIGNEIQEIITTAGKELCRSIADKVHELDPYLNQWIPCQRQAL